VDLRAGGLVSESVSVRHKAVETDRKRDEAARWQETDGWIVTRTTSKQSIVLVTSNHRCIARSSMTDNRIGSTSTTAQMQLNRAGPSHHRPYPSDDWSQRLDRQSKDHHHHSGADTLAMAMIVLVVFVGVDCCPALQSRRIRASMTFDPKSSPAPRLSARRASSLSSLIFFSSQRHTSIYRVHE